MKRESDKESNSKAMNFMQMSSIPENIEGISVYFWKPMFQSVL